MQWNKEKVTNTVFDLIKQAGNEWTPLDDLSCDTMLNADLGLSSVDFFHLTASIDMSLNLRLPYEDLTLRNGIPVTDLAVSELVDFVMANQHLPAPKVQAAG